MAIWAAKRYTADHIFDYIEIDKQHAIFEVEVPKAWLVKASVCWMSAKVWHQYSWYKTLRKN